MAKNLKTAVEIHTPTPAPTVPAAGSIEEFIKQFRTFDDLVTTLIASGNSYGRPRDPVPARSMPARLASAISAEERAKFTEFWKLHKANMRKQEEYTPDRIDSALAKMREDFQRDPTTNKPPPTRDKLKAEFFYRRRAVAGLFAREHGTAFLDLITSLCQRLLATIEEMAMVQIRIDLQLAGELGIDAPIPPDYCTRCLLCSRTGIQNILRSAEQDKTAVARAVAGELWPLLSVPTDLAKLIGCTEP